VLEHLADRDRGGMLGQLRQVLADRLVELELAVLREQQHRRCGELFRDGSRLEDRVRAIRHVVLEVRHAVGFLEDDTSVLRHTDGTARSRCGPGREKRVNLPFADRLWLGGRNRLHGEQGRQQSYRQSRAFCKVNTLLAIARC
jgi:hypothetical protein